jgi:hypothetical protein
MRRAFVLLSMLLAACAAPDPRFRDPTLAEWRAADFGTVPENYDMAIRSYLETVLRDPLNATLTIKTGPEKTWVGEAPNFLYGYGVCVTITEASVYSAFADFGPTFFLLVDNKVVQMREGSEGERLCTRLGRNPEGTR